MQKKKKKKKKKKKNLDSNFIILVGKLGRTGKVMVAMTIENISCIQKILHLWILGILLVPKMSLQSTEEPVYQGLQLCNQTQH